MSNNSEAKDRPCPPDKHVLQSDGDCYTCGWHVTAHAADPVVAAESLAQGDCPYGRPDASTYRGDYLDVPW